MKKLLTVLLCLLNFIYFTGCSTATNDFIPTPNFVGLTLEEAQEEAEKKGLQVKIINDVYDGSFNDGVVIEQSVHSDVIIAKNGTIKLFVNNNYYSMFNMVNVNDDYSTRYYGAIINGGTPSDIDKYLHLNTFVINSINSNKISETMLFIPKTYRGKPISGLGANLLQNTNLRMLIIPENISFVDSNLCGYDGVNYGCTSLKTIVCLGKNPFYLMSLALSQEQLDGGCKIYVPDDCVDIYKNYNIGVIPLKSYSNLIYSINELDYETKEEIDSFYNK